LERNAVRVVTQVQYSEKEFPFKDGRTNEEYFKDLLYILGGEGEKQRQLSFESANNELTFRDTKDLGSSK